MKGLSKNLTVEGLTPTLESLVIVTGCKFKTQTVIFIVIFECWWYGTVTPLKTKTLCMYEDPAEALHPVCSDCLFHVFSHCNSAWQTSLQKEETHQHISLQKPDSSWPGNRFKRKKKKTLQKPETAAVIKSFLESSWGGFHVLTWRFTLSYSMLVLCMFSDDICISICICYYKTKGGQALSHACCMALWMAMSAW